MIEYKAKTIWAGLVWVHGKYLNKAKNEKQNLLISYEDRSLEVPYDDIRSHIKRSKEVKDNYEKGKVHNQYGFRV
jgi:hypothetical protein